MLYPPVARRDRQAPGHQCSPRIRAMLSHHTTLTGRPFRGQEVLCPIPLHTPLRQSHSNPEDYFSLKCHLLPWPFCGNERLRVDSDDLAAAPADQEDPVETLKQNLQELHVVLVARSVLGRSRHVEQDQVGSL